MSMDWFSRSGREGGGIRTVPPTSPPTPGAPKRGLTAQHVVVGIVGNGVDVRGGLGAPLALVGCHHRRRVDGQPLVGVDGDTEEPRVGLQRERGRVRDGGALMPLHLPTPTGAPPPAGCQWLT